MLLTKLMKSVLRALMFSKSAVLRLINPSIANALAVVAEMCSEKFNFRSISSPRSLIELTLSMSCELKVYAFTIGVADLVKLMHLHLAGFTFIPFKLHHSWMFSMSCWRATQSRTELTSRKIFRSSAYSNFGDCSH